MAQDVTAGGAEARLDGGQPPAGKAANGRERTAALDVCRGLAILTVLFIHVSGHFLSGLRPARSHADPPWGWYALVVPNQAAQWAVPCFLMLSALVNARSVARGDLTQYARRRVQTALLPYVLWSLFYVAVGIDFSGRAVPNAHALRTLLQNGTAWYHLYFFVLVLELYVLLPLLVPLFARRPPLWAVAVGAVTLQTLVYLLNRFVSHGAFQGTILWDVLPVALGLWLWSQSARLPDVLKMARWVAGAAGLVALAVYLPLAVSAKLGHAINTALYQFGEWGYTAAVSVLALALAAALGAGRSAKVLGYLGAESLAIYVLHPLAILGLDKLGVSRHLGTAAGLLVYYAACLVLPLAASWVWGRAWPRAEPGVPLTN